MSYLKFIIIINYNCIFMNFCKFVLVVALVCFATDSYAQNDGRSSRRERQNNVDMSELNNRRATRLAKDMKLDDEINGKFVVLYLDYLAARHNAANPKGGDVETASNRIDYDELTDAEAKELIEKRFAAQDAQLKVDKEYYPKFLEFLTPVQVARVYLNSANANGARMGTMPMGGMRPMGGGNFGAGGFGGPGGGF